GKIYESNSYVLASMLKRLGCEVRLSGIVADELDTLRAAFQQASEQSDLVISTGGVSVGEADFVRDVLDEQGEVTLWKLAIKPGKPFAFGTLANSLFAGLPGNPVSAAVTFDQLVVPVIRKLAGERMDSDSFSRVLLSAELTQNIRHRPGRLELQRGLLARAEAGQLVVTPLARQGSALLTTLSEANCYIRVPQENEGYSAGEQVEVELFEPYLGS
ncbi:MAG: molybdopterin molybdotransferase MoeA, partial [Oceanobacter sp.]